MKIKPVFKVLRWLRILLAAAFFIMLSLFFVCREFDFLGNPHGAVVDLQFWPALLRMISHPGIIDFVVGAGGILLLTLLFGRVFCSVICPFGILQDIISFLQKKVFYRKRRYNLLPSYKRIRIVVLVGAVLCLLTGFLVPVFMLEPFANFGRITTFLFVPVATFFNNLAVRIVGAGRFDWLEPVEYPLLTFSAFSVAVVVLVVIIVLAFMWGRFFCNTLCPVGALLSFVSRFSLFKMKIDRDACTNCASCVRNCKAGCIDVKSHHIDNERCVMCFNCGTSCRFDAIKLTASFKRSETPPVEQADISRRNFLIASGVVAAGAIAAPPLIARSIKGQVPVMPPGAMNLDHFQSKCVSCHLCVSSCPTKVIKPSTFQYGLSGFMQPMLDFNRSMCEFDCSTCSNVCPTGALKPLSQREKHELQIGRVEYDQKLCVVFTDKTHCGACAEHCPTGAVVMKEWKDGLTIPVTDVSTCVGCGSCENICPVKPVKAIVVKGVEKQVKAAPPKFKDNGSKSVSTEFPF